MAPRGRDKRAGNEKRKVRRRRAEQGQEEEEEEEYEEEEETTESEATKKETKAFSIAESRAASRYEEKDGTRMVEIHFGCS